MRIRGADKLGSVPQTTSRKLTSRLVRAILKGEYKAGQKLPTERELSESLGVSRHTLREALKRVEAMGLLRIKQGSGVFVNDVALSGGMELLEYMLVDDNGIMDIEVLRDFFLFWFNFMGELVSLSTSRRTEEELEAMETLIRERGEAIVAGESTQLLWKRDEAFLHALAQSSHSQMYRLAFNTLFRSVLRLLEQEPFNALELHIPQDYFEELLTTLRTNDPQAAAETVRKQVQQAGSIFLELFEPLASST